MGGIVDLVHFHPNFRAKDSGTETRAHLAPPLLILFRGNILHSSRVMIPSTKWVDLKADFYILYKRKKMGCTQT